MEAQASGSYPVATDLSNSAMEVQASDSLSSSRQQIIATCAIEAQASGSYPAAAADHSNSTMEAQARGSYSAAADHSNSAMEAQASSSYPAAATAAAAGKQQIIATVLWKRRLVAAIQQLYKLLYKSCIEAKQNNVAGRDCNCSARSGSPVEQLSELKHAFAR